MDISKLNTYLDEQFDNSLLPSIIEFLKIENQSRLFDPNWNTNGLLLKAATHIKEWILQQNIQGLSLELHHDEGFSPFLFGEIKATQEKSGTILCYGHIDKQPPFEGWDEGLGPYNPVIKNGKLYGRGGADDGYSSYGTILAIKALQALNLPHPRIILFFECDEESGSQHIHHYIEKFEKQIGNVDIVFCLDSGCGNYEQLWITTTLRGVVASALKVQVLNEGVHSGDGSGVVPSSFRILRQLINRIEDVNSGTIIDKFQVIIPPKRYEEALLTSQIIGKDLIEKFPWVNQNSLPVNSNHFQAYLNRIWKSQLAVTGAEGLPQLQNAGNVLRPFTTLKLSLRIPPTLKASEAFENLHQILTENPPYNAKVECVGLVKSNGWNAPENQPYLNQILNESSQHFFGKESASIGEGGTIPLMNLLQQKYPHSQFVVTGVLGPFSNAHGPNEFLHLDFCRKLIKCMAYTMTKVNSQLKKQ